MASPFKVSRILKPEHWEPFHRMLRDRRTTIDGALQWLIARRYRISRSAVGGYRRMYLSSSATKLRLASDARSLRRQVGEFAAALSIGDLLSLAKFAAFLANPPAATHGPRTPRTAARAGVN